MTILKSATKSGKLRLMGNLLLWLLLLLCLWVMGGAVAYGWLTHAAHYGSAFRGYAIGYFILAGCMTLAVILYTCKKDMAAAILGTVSYLPMLGILLSAMNIAETNGWVGQTAANFGVSAAAVWRNGQMGNLAVWLLLMLLALSRFFSHEQIVARHQRRMAKENQPAQSVLGDETQDSSANNTHPHIS